METPLFLRHYYVVRLYFPPRKICIHVVYSYFFLVLHRNTPLSLALARSLSFFPRETTLPKYFLIKIHFQDL